MKVLQNETGMRKSNAGLLQEI